MSTVTCPSCDAPLPPAEIAEGWCETCGKRIPSFVSRGTLGPAHRPAPPYSAALDDRYHHFRRVLPLATLGSRLGAALLDGLIALLVYLPGFAVIVAADRDPDETIAMVGAFLLLLGWLGLLIVQVVLLSTSGQSLGKRFVGIRIVRYQDESNPGFMGAWLLRSLVPGLIAAIPCFGMIFSIADIMCIFGEERRCLHDLIAGTKVIDA